MLLNLTWLGLMDLALSNWVDLWGYYYKDKGGQICSGLSILEGSVIHRIFKGLDGVPVVCDPYLHNCLEYVIYSAGHSVGLSGTQNSREAGSVVTCAGKVRELS